MSLEIRPAQEVDFHQVGLIFADENRFHSQLLPERFKIADPIMTRAWFQEILSNAAKMLLVAQDGDHLTGLVLIELMTTPDDPIFQPRRYAYIDELAVLESRRGAGIGRALMEQAHQWIADQGIHAIELNVWERNQSAIRFYERLRYRTFRRGMKLDLD